jgi:predicted nucleic acid-binding protein
VNARFLVVDASVAAQWVLHEPGREEALTLLEDYRMGRLRLAAPRLIVYEIGSVLWKKQQRGELSDSQSEKAYSLFLAHCPMIVEPEGIAESALRLATAHRRTFYDSLYLALALGLGCELITADRKLYNALHPAFPATLLLANGFGRMGFQRS